MKTAPASTFLSHREAPERVAARNSLHGVWARVHGRFLLPPSICDHGDGWDVYDADLAGCRLCGAQHVCSESSCPADVNEHGDRVCLVTGLCVRSLSFSDMEYVDTAVAPLSSGAAAWLPAGFSSADAGVVDRDNESTLYDTIAGHTRAVLCSNGWERSKILEEEKTNAKAKSCMLRILRGFKASNPAFLPIIPDIVAQVVAAVGPMRRAAIITKKERDDLATKCSISIYKHVCLLRSICPDAAPDCKICGTTVGLLYMMRQGITLHGVVVLPRVHALLDALPIEGHLQPILGLRAKCITETENAVKSAMKSVGRDVLRKNGVALVDRPI